MDVESLGSLVLGLVPGLPYVLTGRFGRVWLLWVAWLVLFCMGMFLYGLPGGWALIGLAAAVHAWMVFRHRLLDLLQGFGERIVVLLFLVLVLLAAYVWVPRLVIPGLACVRSTMAIPFYRIETGDALLVRRAPGELMRGMIVGFRTHTYQVAGQGALTQRHQDAETLGQVVGLPGEVVEVRGNAFAVDGQALEGQRYPLAPWLQGRQLTVHLAEGQYFVSCDFRVLGRGVALDNTVVQEICVVPRGRIDSRAFWLWSPLSRRGRLRAD